MKREEPRVCNIEGCDCASYERDTGAGNQSITAAEFSERFAGALKAYLESNYGKGDIHIDDLAVATASYAESFWITTNYF